MYDLLGKTLVFMGVVLVVVGLVFLLLPKVNFGGLPLDFHFRWGNVDVYIPLGTSILVSLLLTLLLNGIFWLIAWLTRG